MPQECRWPGAMLAKANEVGAAAGVQSAVPGMARFARSPQQCGCPAAVMPHVPTSMWPAPIAENLTLPSTCTGLVAFTIVCGGTMLPMYEPSPQQYAAPAAVMPHVWLVPTDSRAKVRPPPTATGAVRFVVVPSPSCPEALEPQQ